MTNALLDRAIAAGTCDFLQQSGSGAMAYAAWGLLTPGPFDEFGAIAYAGVAQLAYAAGCNWDPGAEGSLGGNTFGCVKKAPGTRNYIVRDTCGLTPDDPEYLAYCAISVQQTYQEIVQVYEFPNYNGPEVSRFEIDAIRSDGTFEHIVDMGAGYDMAFKAGTKLGLYGEGDCLKGGDEEPDAYSYDYTDAETGCSLKVEMLGYAVDGANRVSPAWQVTAGNDGLRANGGVISGDCNFAPTVVVPPFGGPPGGGGGGGPTYLPAPETPDPDGNEPWWMKALRMAIPGVVAGVTEELLEQLLNQTYPESIYRMVSVCEKDADGEPISEAVEIPIPALTAPTAQIARLDAIVELLQAHKNFKQPICNEKPKLEGDWVTLRFESDEPSPNSNRAIRKLLRYRSKSGAELGAITDYWRGFTWTTGPVVVTHKDAWWGTPQVWAISADEGKRVIRHVAREAGIDPDQVGRWEISGSRNPRYGVSLPVRFAQLDGGPWVTQRDSPSGPPLINR